MAPLDGNKKGLRVQIKQVRRGRWLGGKGGGGRWGGGGQGLSRWIDDYEIFVDLARHHIFFLLVVFKNNLIDVVRFEL